MVHPTSVMEKLIEYTSSEDVKGYLEVVKIHKDGTEELHFSDKNVITSGMGVTLLEAFNTTTSRLIGNFQIVNFQVGVGGSVGYQVSTTGALGSALTPASQYGTNPSFEVETATIETAGVRTTSHVLGIIPWAYIKKLTPTRVLYTIYLDENSCNGLSLNEVGLFSNNIYNLTPAVKFLCAYRYFNTLVKQDSFSVRFRWVIEF